MASQFELFKKYVDHYIVVTEFCADFIVDKLGVKRENVSVIPCAVDVPEHAVENPEQGEYAAFAGRFVHEKGVEVLIEACRQARIPLKLAGWEATHPAIRAGDDIECIMNKDRAELDQFYRNARMIVVPSIWYETFGLVAAEGSALGLPVIASRIGALQETVDHQITGLHVNPNDVDDLSKAIKTLWDSPELVRQYGQAGRKKIATEYTKKRHTEGHLSVYRKLGRARMEATRLAS